MVRVALYLLTTQISARFTAELALGSRQKLTMDPVVRNPCESVKSQGQPYSHGTTK
jgi:hypothetical protein